MVAHESSKAHRGATMTLCRRAKASGRVNLLLIEQCHAERIYAKAVLERVFATIKFLPERSLAFRGNDQVIASNGNFLAPWNCFPSLILFFLLLTWKSMAIRGRGQFLTCLPLHVTNS